MTEKIEQTIKEIESGKRTSIFGISFTLEEYLSKIDNETTFLEYLLKDIVGDELYNMLNAFYCNNIAKSNSEQLKTGRNL